MPAAVATAVLMLSAGCQSSRYAEPFGFGTMDRQKARAADFDPYPLNDIGPPVMGGRPRGFMEPTPEPSRIEQQAKGNPWAGYRQR